MSDFLYWSGVALWALIAIGAAYVAYRIVEDAITCARFVYRRVRLGGFVDDATLWQKATGVTTLWWVYFIGLKWRPSFVSLPSGERAYWPGEEPERSH